MSQEKKSKGIRISPCTNFLQCLFLHIRTFEFQFRTRVISQNACFFYILRFGTYFKIKNIIFNVIQNNFAIDGTYVLSIAEIVFVQSWRASTHPNPYVRMLKGFFNFLHPTRTLGLGDRI